MVAAASSLAAGSGRPRQALAPGLPPVTGIGLGLRHLRAIQDDPEPPALVEIHAENWFTPSAPLHAALDRVRARSALSIHGVGLSLGGEQPLDGAHLDALAGLLRRHPPLLVSEHLAWTRHGHSHLPDLLPLRYDTPTLVRVCRHIDQVQERLGRRLLLENPARYLTWRGADHDEPGFISEVVRRTGCGLLLDLCNLVVTCGNEALDPDAYLDALPLPAVAEIHLAGPAVERDEDGGELLVDDHGRGVTDAVWRRYEQVLARTGPVPTVIEWDNGDPDYPAVRAQAASAAARLHPSLPRAVPA